MPTADYTKKAVRNYQAKFDLVQVRFPKGTKDKILASGQKCNDFIVKCVLDALGASEQPQKDAEKEQTENLPPKEAKEQPLQDWTALQPLIDAKKVEQEEAKRIKQEREEQERQERRKKALAIAESMRYGEEAEQ